MTMSKIFYGLAGEGRGHATRASTIVEALRGECSFTLFTSDQALELLGRRYASSEVRLGSRRRRPPRPRSRPSRMPHRPRRPE